MKKFILCLLLILGIKAFSQVDPHYPVPLLQTKGADVASAATLTLGGDGNYFDVTGTTTISEINAAISNPGQIVILHFDGILTLEHDATNLHLPSEANITTAVGDEFIFIEYDTNDWRCIGYALADGTAIIGGSGSYSVTNESNNRVVTSVSAGVGNAEANLTFDGSTLDVTGDADIDNININGNTISATNTNGDVNINADGIGDVQVNTNDLIVDTSSGNSIFEDNLEINGSASDPTIGANTSDAADNEGFYYHGGGSIGSTRGAQVGVFGNEHATFPGDLYLSSGETGDIVFDLNNASGSWVFSGTGGNVATVSNAGDWKINSTIAGNSGYADLTIGDASSNRGLQIFGGASNHSGIVFHDADITSTSRSNYNGGIFYDHASDRFEFWVNKAERIYFTSTGDLGIGTNSPDGTLHVLNGSAGSVTASSNANELTVENSGNAGISILTPDANASVLYFGSASDETGALMRWVHDSDLLRIGTVNSGGTVEIESGDGTDAIEIDASQNVTITDLAGSGTRTVVADANGELSATNTSGDFVENGGNTGSNTRIVTKIIQIGDWDMDATLTVAVAHGLTYGDIRSVSVSIRNDADSSTIMGTGAATGENIAINWGTTNINLSRLASGAFDNTTYDSTGYNRGWITIVYEQTAL